MTLPAIAKFESLLGSGMALWDVSHVLPHGKGAYKVRDVGKIQHLYIHKSGADGPSGYTGCLGMARYCIDVRGWPGAPYTYWVPRSPDLDPMHRMVAYRCQPDTVISYHTKGASDVGVAIALQGNYDGEWDLIQAQQPRITVEPSLEQQRLFEALVAYVAKRHLLNLTGRTERGWVLSGHWEAPQPKPVCPGDWARHWIQQRRGEYIFEALPRPTGPTPLINWPHELPTHTPAPIDIQRALSRLGYDPGALDGVWGYKSRRALERFQADQKLEVDGWFGPATASKLLLALRKAGVSEQF